MIFLRDGHRIAIEEEDPRHPDRRRMRVYRGDSPIPLLVVRFEADEAAKAGELLAGVDW